MLYVRQKNSNWKPALNEYLCDHIKRGFNQSIAGYEGRDRQGIEDHLNRTVSAVANTLTLLFSKGLVTQEEMFEAAGASGYDSDYQKFDSIVKED